MEVSANSEAARLRLRGKPGRSQAAAARTRVFLGRAP